MLRLCPKASSKTNFEDVLDANPAAHIQAKVARETLVQLRCNSLMEPMQPELDVPQANQQSSPVLLK